MRFSFYSSTQNTHRYILQYTLGAQRSHHRSRHVGRRPRTGLAYQICQLDQCRVCGMRRSPHYRPYGHGRQLCLQESLPLGSGLSAITKVRVKLTLWRRYHKTAPKSPIYLGTRLTLTMLFRGSMVATSKSSKLHTATGAHPALGLSIPTTANGCLTAMAS